jgi:hypothetical protein
VGAFFGSKLPGFRALLANTGSPPAIGLGRPLRLRTEKGAYRGVERGFRAKIFAQIAEEAPSLHFSSPEISDFKALA